MNNWIDEDDLPVRADLKVVRIRDPDYGMTKDEIEDRNEFIRCYILSGFDALLTIPVQKYESDFFVEDWAESAFNTEDFFRIYRTTPFNRYAYRIKKILEKVRDLAIYHSCLTSFDGRMRVKNRYEHLVKSEFGNRADWLTKKYAMTKDPELRIALWAKMAELKKRIIECKELWELYAPCSGDT